MEKKLRQNKRYSLVDEISLSILILAKINKVTYVNWESNMRHLSVGSPKQGSTTNLKVIIMSWLSHAPGKNVL